jgi:hypothetical protein
VKVEVCEWLDWLEEAAQWPGLRSVARMQRWRVDELGGKHHTTVYLLVSGIWDGAPIHRSRMVSEFIASTHGGIAVERLPAYAPKLNPVEYMWAHLKQHEIGNLIVRRLGSSACRRQRPCEECAADIESSPLASLRPNSGPNVSLLCKPQ